MIGHQRTGYAKEVLVWQMGDGHVLLVIKGLNPAFS